jgi:hypothetical protein
VLLAMEWARTNQHRGFICSWPQLGGRPPAEWVMPARANQARGSHFRQRITA